jgi:TonB family protein
MPDAQLAWPRQFGLRALADIVTFVLPENRVVLDLGGLSPRMPAARLSWRAILDRPGELPLRLWFALADMLAMPVTSSRRVLLALDNPSPRMPERGLSWPRRLGLAAVVNLTAVALLVVLAGGAALSRRHVQTPQPASDTRMVFVVVPEGVTAGGGGGGGNRTAGPIQRASAPLRQAVQHAEPTPVPTPAPSPIEAHPVASSAVAVAGLPSVDAVAASAALGTGDGGGVGGGEGSGVGPGRGPGIGPGEDGGVGGGVYRLGAGVIAPVLISQVRPNYTSRALANHLEGSVLLEVIIRHTGLPDAIRVVRSLDPLGLDEEAIRAVQQWRFRPGRVGSTPVDVLVTCIVDFHLR